MMQGIYYHLDLAVAVAVPLLLYLLRWTGRTGPKPLRQFWLGVAVGFTWELPIFVGSTATEAYRTIHWITPLPLHWTVFMTAHTLWDGGLFLLGCLILRGIFGASALQQRDGRQLLVFVLFGQVQAVIVELSSTLNSAWAFLDLWWNPALFQVNGHNHTALPQVFWLWGSLVYYFIWLRLEARS